MEISEKYMQAIGEVVDMYLADESEDYKQWCIENNEEELEPEDGKHIYYSLLLLNELYTKWKSQQH